MKIGIVNDLPMAAEVLRRALALAPEHQVAWIAKDGYEAVELCALQTPDLVLMNLVMPGMDGVEATRRIMARTPCAIMIVTISVESNASRVFEAMGYGALDAIDTPQFRSGDMLTCATPLLAKIAAIGRLIGEAGTPLSGLTSNRASSTSAQTLIAVGASAGGPAALSTVLHALPRDFPAAIIIVQHVDERFVGGMVEWLGQQSPLPVRIAKEGDRPLPGTALVAGTGDHLVLTAANRLGYTPEPREYVYRPSVDVFFHSITRFWPGKAIGVLLTGMGSDGALGLKALRAKGHYTITQDAASSAVYGMPKAAAAMRAAVDILPLKSIGPGLIAALATTANRGATA